MSTMHKYRGWDIVGAGGFVTVHNFYATRQAPLANESYSRKFHHWFTHEVIEDTRPTFHGWTLRDVKAQIDAIEDGRSTFYALPSWQREALY